MKYLVFRQNVTGGAFSFQLVFASSFFSITFTASVTGILVKRADTSNDRPDIPPLKETSDGQNSRKSFQIYTVSGMVKLRQKPTYMHVD